MKFKDLFREKYRVALHSARANDAEGTIKGLNELSSIFARQYNSDNGDTEVIKIKLNYWKEIFERYAQIIAKYGLQEGRVQKFFGLSDNVHAPSLSDYMKGEIELPSVQNPIGGVDIEGIVPIEEPIAKPSVPAKSDLPSSPEPAEEKEEPLPTNPEDEPNGGDDDMPEVEDKRDEDKSAFAPKSLKDFIGQQHVVKPLLKEIAIAKNEGRHHLDNILLFGNPGLGKTTLMELIADELGVGFELLDCSQFRNSRQSLKALQNFLMRVARENKPVVLAFDEIHMLTRDLQSSLLTLLNNRVYVSPLDINGQCKRIAIDEFTFIAATTDDDKVIDTIKNRCLRLKFQLVDYSTDELRLIYKNKIAAKGLTADEEVIDVCIPRSRGAMRYVNSYVEGLNNALYDDEGNRLSKHITVEVALKYFEEMHIDPMGLSREDLKILQTIADEPSGYISADVLSARVGMDTKKYLSEYERYLSKIGFVNVSHKGRSITEKAKQYISENESQGE